MRSQFIAFVLVLLASGTVSNRCLCSEEASQGNFHGDGHRLTLYDSDNRVIRTSTVRSRVSPSPISLISTSVALDPTESFFPDDPPEPSMSTTTSEANGSALVPPGMSGGTALLPAEEEPSVVSRTTSLSNGVAAVSLRVPEFPLPEAEQSPARSIPDRSRSSTSFHMGRPFDDLVYVEGPKRRYVIAHDSRVKSVRADWHANRILTIAGSMVYVWHLESQPKREVTCYHHGESPSDAWFMRRRGERYIISSRGDSFLRWSAINGRCQEKKEARDLPDGLLAHLYAPSKGARGHTLTINGKTVFIMDQAQQVMKIGHDKRVQCARFSPNGAYVVTGAGNNAYVWQVARRRHEQEHEQKNREILTHLYGASTAKDICG